MLVFDLIDMQELQGFVRAVVEEVERDQFTLSQWLPNRSIDDIEYRFGRNATQDQDAAQVRAWDAEASIAARRAEYSRVVGELPPISRKIRLGEEERLRMRALERGNNSAIVDAVYDDAANMARAVAARLELMRGEALLTAQVAINENGVQQTVNFGRAGGHTVAPGTLWSNNATSTPVTDLRAWRQTYIDENGEPPGAILTSERVISQLLTNAQIRDLADVPASAPSIINPNTVTAVLQAYQIPIMVAYETRIRVNGVRVRVIPDDRLIMLPAPGNTREMGETLFGTTAEALELVGAQQIDNDQAPGMVAVIDKTFDTLATWTKAAAIGLPIMYEPNRTLVADCL
jgi:hypothetical protein